MPTLFQNSWNNIKHPEITLYFTIIMIKGWFILLFDTLNFSFLTLPNGHIVCMWHVTIVFWKKVNWLCLSKSDLCLQIVLRWLVNEAFFLFLLLIIFYKCFVICGINCGPTVMLTGIMYMKLSIFPECSLPDASTYMYR